MKFCALVLELHLPQKFYQTHRQIHRHTDRHFPEIVKLLSGHPKTCKSIKNQKSEIFTKPILSFIYIEKRKNCKVQIIHHKQWTLKIHTSSAVDREN